MTGQELVTALQERLGKRTDLTFAVMTPEIELVKTTILEKAAFRPWFLQDEDTSISTVASQEYVALPTDFLAFDPDDEWSGIAYNDTSSTDPDPWVDIVQDDFNAIRNYYKDEVAGKPVKFGLVGLRAYFRPIPDAVYQLRFRHYAQTTAIANDSNAHLWLTHAPDWVMGEVGFILASQYTKNTEDAVVFQNMAKAGRSRCYLETVARAEAGKMRSMGDE